VTDQVTEMQNLNQHAKSLRPYTDFLEDVTDQELVDNLDNVKEAITRAGDVKDRVKLINAYSTLRDVRYARMNPVRWRRLAMHTRLREAYEAGKIGADLGL